MKARIHKKLSKKIAQIIPHIYKDAWIEKDVCQESWTQGSCVSGVLCVGGGVDYWGEGQDAFTVLEDFINHHDWHKPIFKTYPEGHQWHGSPVRRKKRITGKYLISCAKRIAQHHQKSEGK